MGNVKLGKFTASQEDMASEDYNEEEWESLSDVETALDNIGIKLRENATTYRSTEDVLKNIAEIWDTISETERNSVASALAGTRQREIILTLFENWDQVENFANISANSYGTAQEKMEAFTDSIEASQNRLTVAMERWVLQLEANGAIKLFYDTLSTAVENLDVLIATIGGLLILTNFNKVVNTLITAGGSLGSQFTKLGGAIETIIALSSGQGGYRKEVYNEAVSNFQSAYVRGQQKNYANTLAQFIPTMGAETVGKFASLQNNLITSTQAQIDDFFEALENGFIFQDPKVIKDMIAATEDQTKVAKLNAQLTRQQNIASQLLNVAQEGQGKQTLQAIANGEALEGTTHNLSAAQQELTNTTKQANQQMLNQIKTNANNFQQRGGKSGAALQTGIGILSLGAGIGGAQVGGKIGSFFGDTGSVIGTTIGTMAAPAMVQALGKKISGAAAGTMLSKVGLAIANPIASIAVSVLMAAAPSIIDAFYTSAEERAEELAEKFNQESDKYTTYLNATTSVADYDELVKGVDALGRNVSLTDEEYQKFVDTSNELASVFPSLVTYTDAAGNKFLGLKDSVSGVSDAIENLVKQQQRIADQALLEPDLLNENYKKAKEQYDIATKQAEKYRNVLNEINENEAWEYEKSDRMTDIIAGNRDSMKLDVGDVSLANQIDNVLSELGIASHKDNTSIILEDIAEDEITSVIGNIRKALGDELSLLEDDITEARSSLSSEIEAIFREMEYNEDYAYLFETLTDEQRQIAQNAIGNYTFTATDGEGYRVEIEEFLQRTNKLFEENPIIAEIQTKVNEANTVNEANNLREQLASELVKAFGKGGYDDVEKAIILGLRFDIQDDGSLTDQDNLYDTLLGITGTEELKIKEENLGTLNLEEEARVLELFRKGIVDATTNWYTLRNLLDADIEAEGLSDLLNQADNLDTIMETLDARVERYLKKVDKGTISYDDKTIAKTFNTWPEELREALQDSAEAIADGSSNIEAEIDRLKGYVLREMSNTYENLATEMNSMTFGEDVEIEGTIDELSELASALENTANSYDKLAQAEIEFQKYGRLSGKTMLDLLSSNIMYASVLDVTGEKITLQKDAQQKMLALQLASIKAQIQEAITEKELAIQKNNTTIKTLDAVGASGVVIEQSDSVIEALNNQAKAYASTAQAAAAMYQAVQGNIEEAQSLLKEQNWAEDTQIGNVESTTSSVYYTQAEAKAEAERLRQENARYESELEGLKSTYEALGGDEGTIDVSEFMWWYDPGQMEEYNDALSNASDAEEELMTNLERLQKFRDLIDKEWEAMQVYNKDDKIWGHTEYFNKMRDALEAEIEETKKVINEHFNEAMSDGVFSKEEEEEYFDYQADLIELQRDLNNLDDEEIEDEISLLETREASVYALIDAQNALIETSDTEEDLVERQAELLDLLREELDLRKSINDYVLENLERSVEYVSGKALSNSRLYDTYYNLRKNGLETEANLAMEDYQLEFQNAYEQYLSEGMTGPEAYQAAQHSEGVMDAMSAYFDAIQAQGDLVVERFEDRVNELETTLDELEQSKPEEWSSIGQISPYYNAVMSNIKAQISQIEEALQNTEMMTDEQIQEWVSKYNDAIAQLAENQKQILEDTTNYQSEMFNALVDWIEEYRENIEQVRDEVSDYYDDLITPLERYRDDLDDANELLQLQQDLLQAREKERVYREGSLY